MVANSPPIALTMGEPAGIGAELALKSWHERLRRGVPPFFLLDDPDRLRTMVQSLDLDVRLEEILDPADARRVFDYALPVLPHRLNAPVVPGQLDVRNAESALSCIERAVQMVKAGQASAIVTNPIQKSVLYEIGFRYPGHTEYLAALAGGEHKAVMMLAAKGLRVIPATVHVPLKDVPARLSKASLVEIARIADRSLRLDFGLSKPRLAVAGLNPHAGEDGGIGREEIDIITPAIEAMKAEGVTAEGPFSADTLFHDEARRQYDLALCMYHDQALIPLKTLDFHGGVNVTLGLPFVRTSPDHGTALNLAGHGSAKVDSLVAALRMAAEMVTNRAKASAISSSTDA